MKARTLPLTLVLSLAATASSSAAVLWMVGRDDNAWPAGNGGGPNTTFVQEAGTNALPGNPANPEVNRQGDDDYYFAGIYSTVVDGGTYTPVGPVLVNEEGAERAFAGTDNTLRYHFNLPAQYADPDYGATFDVTWDARNLDQRAVNNDPRYGLEVWVDGAQVEAEQLVTPALLDTDFTTASFTFDPSEFGPGFDHYVELRGINYNSSGGGNWMGIDYVQLNINVPEPSRVSLALIAVLAIAFRRRR